MQSPFDAPPPAALGDDEPRAREVIDASPGEVPGHDPSRRWERPFTVPPDAPTQARSAQQMGARSFEPDALRRIELGRSEYFLSPELSSAMNENAPQWFLRDLDRPLDVFPVRSEPQPGTDPREHWNEALQTAQAARVLPSLPRVISAVEILAEERQRRGELFAGVWQPVLQDDQPRNVVVLYDS